MHSWPPSACAPDEIPASESHTLTLNTCLPFVHISHSFYRPERRQRPSYLIGVAWTGQSSQGDHMAEVGRPNFHT